MSGLGSALVTGAEGRCETRLAEVGVGEIIRGADTAFVTVGTFHASDSALNPRALPDRQAIGAMAGLADDPEA